MKTNVNGKKVFISPVDFGDVDCKTVAHIGKSLLHGIHGELDNLVMHTQQQFGIIRFFYGIPKIDNHGHADSCINSDIMIARGGGGFTNSDRIAEMIDPDFREFSEEEYEEARKPWGKSIGYQLDFTPRVGNQGKWGAARLYKLRRK